MVRPSDAPSEPRLPGGGFLFNVNLVFISTVAAYGLGFVTAVLMARALGDEGLGVTALYRNAVTLGFAFLSLGIATALVYYVARRDYEPRLAMEIGLTITALATILTAIGVLIAWLFFDDELSSDHVPYWLALVAIPAVIQFRIAESVLRAQARFGAMNLVEVSMPLSILVFLGATELLYGLTVERTIVAWTLALLPPIVFGYALLSPAHWPRRFGGGPLLWQATRFGVQGQLSNLIQLLNLRLDSYLVLLLVNSAGVGLYAVGVSLSEGMWFIANSVGVVLLTDLTASDDAEAARMTPIVCRNTLLVTALAAVGAAIVAPVLVPAIFGSEYEDSVLPFIWLLPGTVAAAGTKILAAYVFSRGRPLINAQIGLVTLIVTVVGDLILIPAFEVSGAAAAASFAYGVSLALTALAYRRLSGGSVGDTLLPRRDDIALYVDGLRSLRGRLLPAGRSAGGPA
ncbi:MAG TPA: oligosaccharide flippase family protein [Dehalococcoidia bacterium]|jgi:O-antigen/teichoic acid export membrane protein|nr:oligosaccharide flippase family protein [Dehalococcoidia bacterium]